MHYCQNISKISFLVSKWRKTLKVNIMKTNLNTQISKEQLLCYVIKRLIPTFLCSVSIHTFFYKGQQNFNMPFE